MMQRSRYPYAIIALNEYPYLLDQLVAQQWHVWGYDDPNDLKQFFAQELDPEHVFPRTWLLMKDDTLTSIIGAVTLSWSEMGTVQPLERNPWLGYLYVEPHYRGQGLAKVLTEFAVEQSAQLGYDQCYLYASDETPRYLKWGWKPLQTLPFQGEDVTVMQSP